jgi:hypothetical protein
MIVVSGIDVVILHTHQADDGAVIFAAQTFVIVTDET